MEKKIYDDDDDDHYDYDDNNGKETCDQQLNFY